MNKGQIYSLDFIIATVLVVVCIGAMLNLYETKNQEIIIKENQKMLQTKLITATEIMLGSDIFNCDINGMSLSHTIDKNKITTITELKKILGLEDMLAQITISSPIETIILANDPIDERDIYLINSNIMLCESSEKINLSTLNDCFDGNCYSKYFTQEILQIKVSK